MQTANYRLRRVIILLRKSNVVRTIYDGITAAKVLSIFKRVVITVGVLVLLVIVAEDHKALLAHYLQAYLVFDTGQQIEYTGMKVIDDTKIMGNYISSLPGDRGEFELSLKK